MWYDIEKAALHVIWCYEIGFLIETGLPPLYPAEWFTKTSTKLFDRITSPTRAVQLGKRAFFPRDKMGHDVYFADEKVLFQILLNLCHKL